MCKAACRVLWEVSIWVILYPAFGKLTARQRRWQKYKQPACLVRGYERIQKREKLRTVRIWEACRGEEMAFDLSLQRIDSTLIEWDWPEAGWGYLPLGGAGAMLLSPWMEGILRSEDSGQSWRSWKGDSSYVQMELRVKERVSFALIYHGPVWKSPMINSILLKYWLNISVNFLCFYIFFILLFLHFVSNLSKISRKENWIIVLVHC